MKPPYTPTLDEAIALARQQYAELLAIRSLDELVRGERGSREQAKRVQTLLSGLSDVISRVRNECRGIMSSWEAIGLTLSDSNADFVRTALFPNMEAIQSACNFDFPLLLELERMPSDLAPLPNHDRIREALRVTATFAYTMMDDGDVVEDAIDTVFGLLDDRSFLPDRWKANLQQLRPVILAFEEKKIPHRIRSRILETYRAFVFEAYMASIALSRALVEAVLVERAPTLGYSVKKEVRVGKEGGLKLAQIIENAASVRPELFDDLEIIRTYGNQVLHPKAKEKVVPITFRLEAYQCIEAATRALEVLYRR